MKNFIALFLFFAVFTAVGQTISTDAQLTTQANVIRNETAAGGNTKGRIADMYQAIIDSKVNRNDSIPYEKISGKPTASNGITKNGNNFSLGGTVSTGVDLNVTGDGYVFIGQSSNNFFVGEGFIALSGLTFINPSGTDALTFLQTPTLSSSLAIPHKGYVDDLARPLYKSVTVAGNIGSGEDVIYTYTVPGGTLASDGEELVLTSFGTFAGSGNSPVVRIRFGSSLLYEHTHGAFPDAVWKIEAHVIRTSATTQKAFIVFTTMVEGTLTRIVRSTGTETLSSSAVFQLTAEGISDNDFVGEYFEVKKLSD